MRELKRRKNKEVAVGEMEKGKGREGGREKRRGKQRRRREVRSVRQQTDVGRWTLQQCLVQSLLPG